MLTVQYNEQCASFTHCLTHLQSFHEDSDIEFFFYIYIYIDLFVFSGKNRIYAPSRACVFFKFYTCIQLQDFNQIIYNISNNCFESFTKHYVLLK